MKQFVGTFQSEFTIREIFNLSLFNRDSPTVNSMTSLPILILVPNSERVKRAEPIISMACSSWGYNLIQ